MPARVPDQGDFIALSFDPQSGHEQRGRRPAFVVSKRLLNSRTGLAILCPVTNAKRGLPFHVEIKAGKKVTGFIVVEQVKSVDFRAREARHLGKASGEVLREVLSILDACIY